MLTNSACIEKHVKFILTITLDYCSLPRVQGNCTEKQPRWYYDTPQRRCMPFYYTGCNGNRNNFISKEACETDCPREVRKYCTCNFFSHCLVL